MDNNFFKERLSNAASWSFSLQLLTQPINFLSSILLARLLLPEDFGLVGMLWILLALGRILQEGGLTISLVRDPDAVNSDFNTVFTINLIMAVILYVVVYLSAPYIADFYGYRQLSPLLRVFGLQFFVLAFSLVQYAKINKSLRFKTQFAAEVPAVIISSLVAVGMAYKGFGVWSLVVKELLFTLLSAGLLYRFVDFIPKFQINNAVLKKHWTFGYKLTINQLGNVFSEEIYKVVVGKMFSASILGFYTRAVAFEKIPFDFFVNIFNRLALPSLSRIQSHPSGMIHLFIKMLQMLLYYLLPVLVFLYISAEILFSYILTDKWLPAVPYFRLLIIAGLFYPIHYFCQNLFNVKGKSNLVLITNSLKNILLLVGLILAWIYGIEGLLYAIIIAKLAATVVTLVLVSKVMEYSLYKFITKLMPIYIQAGICAVIVYFFDLYWLQDWYDGYRLLVLGCICFAVYFFLSLWLNLSQLVLIKQFFLRFIGTRFK